MSRGTTVQKIKVLRLDLSTLERYTDSSQIMVIPDSGSLHVAGTDWNNIQRYMLPEVLLRMDRSKTVPVYCILTESLEVIPTTLKDLDGWLRVNASEDRVQLAQQAVATLERYASTTNQREAFSQAISVVKKLMAKSSH